MKGLKELWQWPGEDLGPFFCLIHLERVTSLGQRAENILLPHYITYYVKTEAWVVLNAGEVSCNLTMNKGQLVNSGISECVETQLSLLCFW